MMTKQDDGAYRVGNMAATIRKTLGLTSSARAMALCRTGVGLCLS